VDDVEYLKSLGCPDDFLGDSVLEADYVISEIMAGKIREEGQIGAELGRFHSENYSV
jgi:hypothetical protein